MPPMARPSGEPNDWSSAYPAVVVEDDGPTSGMEAMQSRASVFIEGQSQLAIWVLAGTQIRRDASSGARGPN